jgi:hypothetical protein
VIISSAAGTVLFAFGEQRPQHASIVICERNRSHIGTVPKLEPVYRNAALISATLNHAYRSTGAVNEQGAEVTLSPFADA